MSTTATIAPKLRKVQLSCQDRPVQIDETEWPILSQALWFRGASFDTAEEIARVFVRAHSDGRRLVYVNRWSGKGKRPTHSRKAGYLIEAGDASDLVTVNYVNRVCEEVDLPKSVARRCVDELPTGKI